MKVTAALLSFVVVLLLIGLLVKSAEAADVTMTAEEQAQCKAQGGCQMVTVQWLQEAMTKAFAAGAEKGKGACFVSTS